MSISNDDALEITHALRKAKIAALPAPLSMQRIEQVISGFTELGMDAVYKDSEATAPTGLVSMSTTTDRTGLPQVQVGLIQFTQSNARKVANEILSLLSEDWDELRDRTNSALAFGPSRDK